MNTFRNIIKAIELPAGSRLINDDVRPLESRRRTYTMLTFHNYLIATDVCISTFIAGSSLIPLGLTWWQAILVSIVGNIIVASFYILGGIHGIYHHIGFCVGSRASWGIYGAYFPVWNRIFLSLVWYGFQSFVGGQCFEVMLMTWDPKMEQHIPNRIPASTGVTSAGFVAYFVYCLLNLPLLWAKPHRLGRMYAYGAIVALIFYFALLIWALATMGSAGFGATLSSESHASSGGPKTLGWMFMYGIISYVGVQAAGILNQSDYTRLTVTPKDAIVGYGVAITFWKNLTSIFGILTVAATEKRYGEALWNPPQLLARILQNDPSSGTRAAIFFAAAALSFAQAVNNAPYNGFLGGLDLASIFPKWINLRRGAFIMAIVSPVVNPWRLVNTATVFLTVVSGYGVVLAPMTGVMLSHYFVVAKRKLNIDDLYRGNKSSIYWYNKGCNWRAPIAWLVGFVPGLPGLIATANTSVHLPDGATELFYINWLYGFVSSSVVFILLHRLFPDKPSDAFANNSMTWRQNRQRYLDFWEGDFEQTLRGLKERELAEETASTNSGGSEKLVDTTGHVGYTATTTTIAV